MITNTITNKQVYRDSKSLKKNVRSIVFFPSVKSRNNFLQKVRVVTNLHQVKLCYIWCKSDERWKLYCSKIN